MIEEVYDGGVYGEKEGKVWVGEWFWVGVVLGEEYFVIGLVGWVIRMSERCVGDRVIKILKEG